MSRIATHPRFKRPPVVQPTKGLSAERWWMRDDDGRLVVRCGDYLPRLAPVPPIELCKGTARVPATGLPDRAPNADRITCALDLRGMDGPEVDEALGVSGVDGDGRSYDAGVVDGWEAGTIIPTHDEVRRLATLTGMYAEWFYMGTLPKIDGFICSKVGAAR